MNPEKEDQIRARAYQIWEREGRPDGQAMEHWERAAREIEAEAGGDPQQAEIPEMPDDFPQGSGQQPEGNKSGGSGGSSGLSGGLQSGGAIPGAKSATSVGGMGPGGTRGNGNPRRSRKSA